MLNAEFGQEISLPETCKEARLIFANNDVFGKFGDKVTYPEFLQLDGEVRHFDCMDKWEELNV